MSQRRWQRRFGTYSLGPSLLVLGLIGPATAGSGSTPVVVPMTQQAAKSAPVLPTPPGSVAAPAVGEVRAERALNGQPVFVIGHEDGSTEVFDAAVREAGKIGRELMWCRETASFMRYDTPTTYDAWGRAVDGAGLRRRLSVTADGRTYIGPAIMTAEGRSLPAWSASCGDSVSPVHEDVLEVGELGPQHVGKVVPVNGVLTISEGAPALMCGGFQGRTTCDPSTSSAVHGVDARQLESRPLRILVGWFLVRVEEDGLHDVSMIGLGLVPEVHDHHHLHGHVVDVTSNAVLFDKVELKSGEEGQIAAALAGDPVPHPGYHYMVDASHRLRRFVVDGDSEFMGVGDYGFGRAKLKDLRALLEGADGRLWVELTAEGGKLRSLDFGEGCG